jgi:hypothetical protein
MRKRLTIIFLSILLLGNLHAESKTGSSDGRSLKKKNPYELSDQDTKWMREATIQQLKGCRVKGANNTWIHTPDGVGN